MSAEEETARHVPVRRSEAAAALIGGGGSISRCSVPSRRRPEHSLESESFDKWRFELSISVLLLADGRMKCPMYHVRPTTGLPFAAPVQSPWLHARCV